jgi:heme/copper-type cytochrome/quinol oxidase subunit 2
MPLPTHDVVVVQVGLGGDLTEHHHLIVLGGGLAGHLGQGVDGQAGIEDGVRDLGVMVMVMMVMMVMMAMMAMMVMVLATEKEREREREHI